MKISVGDKVKIKKEFETKYPKFKGLVGKVHEIKEVPILIQFMDKNKEYDYISLKEEQLEKVSEEKEEEEDADEYVVEITCPDCASELETKCTKCRKKYTFSVLFTEVKK